MAAEGCDPNVDNWLRAERQLYCVPSCELLEVNGRFRLRAALPGLEARQLRLTALPGAIVIRAARAANSESGELLFSEFNRKELLRRIDLPSPINTASVQAKLERGVLELVAAKQTQRKTRARRAGV
ncbi:MAG: Hsp20 family protein [bacterium]|nr:Hsp20 family protein [bacterium]